MNDLEINTAARGIMKYLQQHDPTDSLAILVCTILIFYERAVIDATIEQFADKLKIDLLSVYAMRTIPAIGTNTVQ
jgi:hypothetical protein